VFSEERPHLNRSSVALSVEFTRKSMRGVGIDFFTLNVSFYEQDQNISVILTSVLQLCAIIIIIVCF
jgi:hypothetical protein